MGNYRHRYEVAEEVLRQGGTNQEIQRRIMEEFPGSEENIGRASQYRRNFERYGHCRLQFNTQTSSLEERFDAEMLLIYEKAKHEANYRATRYLQKLRRDGGVKAAKYWLRHTRKDVPSNGFLTLVDAGKLSISLEALVLTDPWPVLFEQRELDLARHRLEKYGYYETGTERPPGTFIAEEVDSSHSEGAVARITVNRYERSRKARNACIAHYGATCYVCDFDFSIYGSKFRRAIHVHHLVSVASIGKEYKVHPIADLIPVCPNCHAVIHQRIPCYGFNEVRKMLGKPPKRRSEMGRRKSPTE